MKEGWELKKMSDLFDVKSSKRVHKADWKDEGVPFYRAREVVKLAKNGIVDNSLFISEDLYQEFTKEKGAPKEGDLIISAVGTLGQCYLVKNTDRFYFKDASVLWFENISNVNVRYIEYAFKSDLLIKQVLHKSMGATVGTLTISRAKIINIPIPPLSEQKQIVTILDKAFAAIDQAKANIEQNIKNAKELFQSKLNEIFSQKGDGWEEKTLGEVCYVVNGYAFKSKDTVEKSGTQLLRMGNLYKNVLDLGRKPVFYPDLFAIDFEDYLLKKGDLIMSLTGTTDKTDFGYTVKVPKTEIRLLLNQRIMKIEVHNSNVLNKDYLKNYLLSPGFLSRLYDSASGTRQANLSSRIVLTLKINFPSKIENQLEVVEQFKQLEYNCNKIESSYSKNLNSLEELKKSILQKAFAGELTSTNPTLTKKDITTA